ncbi:hypothetical protein SAMN02799630_02076 [Paenibacillus sp. UNCCL117]|uniref:hypothetical protein n=1 Tax=unclassified Paenibacillus TaxID=185978 RepID=UPI0008821305|nr:MULTISPECIES: hypothetical protein [unclassified Paenibacillus]SDD01868.1 hypothetical protein SAMN04488602_10551 [Paenibacillus sp. cl123]SFW32600.1 hypothetical protein SAMN02799630_02076 [Paenibacillus sp. UNCCL117]
MKKKRKSFTNKEARNAVKVGQRARASTGQGGNAFAINASDVGVVRTDVAPGR